jgi:hypothetical protein
MRVNLISPAPDIDITVFVRLSSQYAIEDWFSQFYESERLGIPFVVS